MSDAAAIYASLINERGGQAKLGIANCAVAKALAAALTDESVNASAVASLLQLLPPPIEGAGRVARRRCAGTRRAPSRLHFWQRKRNHSAHRPSRGGKRSSEMVPRIVVRLLAKSMAEILVPHLSENN